MATASPKGPRLWAVMSALSGGAAVAAGGFAAHGLKATWPGAAELFEIAAYYQMAHALAAIGLLGLVRASKGAALIALAAFAAGTILFCGSLYAYALTGWRPLAYATPFGGVAFLAGWAAFAVAAWRHFGQDRPLQGS